MAISTKARSNSKHPTRARRYHPWWKWECYAAGFYARSLDGVSSEDCVEKFKSVFTGEEFSDAAERVLTEWRFSCEQFLLNEHINRVAWIGQAAVCISTKVPSRFKFAFLQLSAAQQKRANETAAWHLRRFAERIDSGEWDAAGGGEILVGMEKQRLFNWYT